MVSSVRAKRVELFPKRKMFLLFSSKKEVISSIDPVFQPPRDFKVTKSKNLMPSAPQVNRYLLHLEVSILFKNSVCPE